MALRILDLGAHDGYVSKWLLERWEGDQLRIDGIELMPEAAEKARERGINCKVGAAEDAPDLFEVGSYDAVVAFEVIEHVPDVDRFLTACERMVKPNGRIYISTPDGTFGDGNNPHHLRVYRSIDLTDALRRRGRLCDATVGQDGVTVVSYTPAPRLGDVAIFTGPGLMPWAPADILLKGLGGSETAAVRLAEQLSEVGYVVTVYGEVEQGMFRDVAFRHWSTFDPAEPRVAVIASRMPEVFDRPVAARTRLLWLHDTDCGDRLTERRLERIDRVLTLSSWHEAHVKGLYPFAAAKVLRTRNGITHELFQGEPVERARRVLYTSSPDRGLDLLLELWPRVVDQVPDAELAYCYSPVYWHVAATGQGYAEHVSEHAELVRKMSDQPGVTALGALSQPKLARLMRESLVWCAPSWCTPLGIPFQETSCIGAMEAQAAGLHVVASNWGALHETVKVGHLVDGDMELGDDGQHRLGERWRDAFVNSMVEGLTNPELQAHAQTEGPRAMADRGWDGVGRQFAGLIEGVLVDG